MLRHISIFTLKDKKEIGNLIELLNDVGSNCNLILNSQVGTNITKVELDGNGPDFGDVIQIIDFKNHYDLNAYPISKEHLNLFENGPEMIKVTAIDYEFMDD